MQNLGSFSITARESLEFARASGDFNPLHLDPVAARRTRFGQTLIHGVCGTLKALDHLLAKRTNPVSLASIRVKFAKPATQGQELALFLQTEESMTRLELHADGARCQIIETEMADIAPGGETAVSLSTQDYSEPDSPVELGIADCAGLTGAVQLPWNRESMSRLFPHATRCLPEWQLSALLASTLIVGMKCPGLHSVFAQLELRFTHDSTELAHGGDSLLRFQVLKADPRIDRVEIALAHPAVQGTVEAFFRPPPVAQAGLPEIIALVSDSEFSAQRALVVGASRGLGEVISKVLAAGGARVMMTYAAGEADAARVAREIAEHRGAPGVCHYNVLDGVLSDEMTDFCAAATHIYYLASPAIARSDSNRWNRAQFSRYCDFYIDGLATLLHQVLEHGSRSRALRLFIPSSVFLEQGAKGFDEYIAAKAAAEAFAQCIARTHRNVTLAAPRLPRLHTDQTSAVKNADGFRTLEVIIEQLRQAFDGADHAGRMD